MENTAGGMLAFMLGEEKNSTKHKKFSRSEHNLTIFLCAKMCG